MYKRISKILRLEEKISIWLKNNHLVYYKIRITNCYIFDISKLNCLCIMYDTICIHGNLVYLQ